MTETKFQGAASVRERIARDIERDHKEGTLHNAVVHVFVVRENDRRVQLLVKGLDELAKVAKAYDDINKPDTTFYNTFHNADKHEVLFISAKRKKEQEAALKKLVKLTEAIDKAFLNADYAGLEKALKGGESQRNPDSDE